MPSKVTATCENWLTSSRTREHRSAAEPDSREPPPLPGKVGANQLQEDIDSRCYFSPDTRLQMMAAKS